MKRRWLIIIILVLIIICLLFIIKSIGKILMTGEHRPMQVSGPILPKAETQVEKPSGWRTPTIPSQVREGEERTSTGEGFIKGLKAFQKEMTGVMERAKREEEIVDKLNKMKFIGLAMMMYVEDWDGYYPPKEKLSWCLMPYLKDQSFYDVFAHPDFHYTPPPPLKKMKEPAEI
ncbi:hypothetical protein H5T87_11455, partial [bacterium]|nr:hypothetical protein [bacterium]